MALPIILNSIDLQNTSSALFKNESKRRQLRMYNEASKFIFHQTAQYAYKHDLNQHWGRLEAIISAFNGVIMLTRESLVDHCRTRE